MVWYGYWRSENFIKFYQSFTIQLTPAGESSINYVNKEYAAGWLDVAKLSAGGPQRSSELSPQPKTSAGLTDRAEAEFREKFSKKK